MILDPEKIVKKLLLPDTARVADLGAGTGAFTVAAAKCVPAGKVYSIDLQGELLAEIMNKMSEMRLQNVEIIAGDLEEVGGTKLRDSSVDAVILANTLFQIAKKEVLVQEVKRIMKNGGKLLLVDWIPGTPGIPPLGQNVFSPEKNSELFTGAGFVLAQEIPVGEYHYGIIFTINNKQKI